MSSGVTPARSKASWPERTHGDSVKSSHSLIVVCETASPVPRIHTGALAQSRARSSLRQHDGAAAVGANAAVQLA